MYYCIDAKPGNDGNVFLNHFSYNVFLDPKKTNIRATYSNMN